MGVSYSAYVGAPDTTPRPTDAPSFDPLYGFPSGRTERKMIATEQEMQAAGLEARDRDYCAHKFIDVKACKRENFPWTVACSHLLHEYEQCEFDDYVLRMKEFERERRLRERSKRKAAKYQDETLGN
ncbi:NADH dehydrogenase [ubiquinone] 1 beta subcomplex subunit 7 [Lamellibrachia satsuma]|nr:NADH dehydrogenase [ubiquinone] 1 beta subcomplex subunit 7 [Lamellibrachia satsuma]